MTGERERLPARYAPAAAMAVAGLYPLLPSINFLDRHAVEARRREVGKRKAVRLTLALASVVFALLFASTLLNTYLRHRAEREEALLLSQAPRIAAVERARADLGRLRASYEQARGLIALRTDRTRILVAVGRATPEEVWLSRLRLGAPDGEGAALFLEGFTGSERGAQVLLERLENEPAVVDPRLAYLEAVPRRRRTYGGGGEPLYRFELVAELAPATSAGTNAD